MPKQYKNVGIDFVIVEYFYSFLFYFFNFRNEKVCA